MAVIVYALTNPTMPNLVKIGKTESQDPQIRMDQLYNTSVNFREMGIPVDAKLVFRNDEAVVVDVVGDKKVRMENGEEISLTRARLRSFWRRKTLSLQHRIGVTMGACCQKYTMRPTKGKFVESFRCVYLQSYSAVWTASITQRRL